MTSPYYDKCKRRRTDGPTPCLCCEGECVGQQIDYDIFAWIAVYLLLGGLGYTIGYQAVVLSSGGVP